jgi:hypothetical protein
MELSSASTPVPDHIADTALNLDAIRRVMLRAPLGRGPDGHPQSVISELDAVIGIAPINRMVLIAQVLRAPMAEDEECRRIVQASGLPAGLRTEIEYLRSGRRVLQAPLVRLSGERPPAPGGAA